MLLKRVSDQEAIIELLLSSCGKGGQACWIVNTVKNAQELYQRIVTSEAYQKQRDNIELDLFHARFLQIDRFKKEESIIGKFGKGKEDRLPNPLREKTGRLLIATQVIEQFLDLCFDIMVSQMAPIDLLLQRLGRLHRHQVNDVLREEEDWKKACLFVHQEYPIENFLDLKYDPIYHRIILYRTALLLNEKKRREITLPDDVKTLVEWVYGGEIENARLSDSTPLPAIPGEHRAKADNLWEDWQNQIYKSRAKIEGPGAEAQKFVGTAFGNRQTEEIDQQDSDLGQALELATLMQLKRSGLFNLPGLNLWIARIQRNTNNSRDYYRSTHSPYPKVWFTQSVKM